MKIIPFIQEKMLSEEMLEKMLEARYGKPIKRILEEDLPKVLKKNKKGLERIKRASENSNINNLKNRKMKTKVGTAKPSGAGVGKGGPKTSPTDGRSLKPSGKGTSKGGKKK